MLSILPTGKILGATVTGIDLKRSVTKADFATLLRGLGDHGVLHFPNQLLNAGELKRFSEQFGSLQVLSVSKYFDPEFPEVTIISNVKKDAKPIGKSDAGQFWHTDMTYREVPGFVNVLVAYEVPIRNGKPLGATEFTNTQAAYDDLPEEVKERLAHATAIHFLNKNWEYLRGSKKSSREPLTAEEVKALPPVRHPVFLTHPITGRKVIFVTPSFVVNIDGMAPEESQKTLDYLCDHVLKPKYRYTHDWTVGDVLMWDHLGTWHNAIADYGPTEHRLIKRCQVMADRIFEPGFVKTALSA